MIYSISSVYFIVLYYTNAADVHIIIVSMRKNNGNEDNSNTSYYTYFIYILYV